MLQGSHRITSANLRGATSSVRLCVDLLNKKSKETRTSITDGRRRWRKGGCGGWGGSKEESGDRVKVDQDADGKID